MTTVSYRGFAERKDEADLYVSYQGRYRDEPKHCEKVAAQLVEERVGTAVGSWLDIGCSTGNFIAYLRRQLTHGWSFDGVDLMPQAIAEASGRPIGNSRFRVGDVLSESIYPDGVFDVVSLMTVVYAFSDSEFEQCVETARRLLKPGGYCVIFDLFHPWEAHYQIVERSRYHPDGHPLNMRPLSYVRRVVEQAGFDVCEFRRFTLPDGLPAPYDAHDLTSYTVESDLGQLIYRGPLSQPFCHAVLRAA